jgi:type II secretory pathway component PulF
MSLYFYRAVDPKGSQTQGNWVGDSPKELYDFLKKQQLTLVYHRRFRQNTFTALTRSWFDGQKNVPFFCTQMHQFLTAKISLMDALQIATESQEDKGLKIALVDIMKRIQSGESLGQAFKNYPTLFEPFFIISLSMGEKTGNLAQAFETIAQFYEQKNQRHSALKKALAYPLFLFCILVFVFYGLSTFVLPNMVPFFDTLGTQQQPLALRTLQQFIMFMEKYGDILFYGVCTGVFILLVGLSFSKRVRESFIDLKFHIPVIGFLLRNFYMADFLKYVSLLLKQKENLITALEHATQSVPNKNLQKQLGIISNHVQQGKSFRTAMGQSNLFNSVILKFIEIGEHTGTLDTMLMYASENLSRQSLLKMNTLIGRVGPVFISIIGAVIIWIVLATVVPIYDVLAVLHF